MPLNWGVKGAQIQQYNLNKVVHLIHTGKWLSGRASALHAEGPEFDPPFLHNYLITNRQCLVDFFAVLLSDQTLIIVYHRVQKVRQLLTTSGEASLPPIASV